MKPMPNSRFSVVVLAVLVAACRQSPVPAPAAATPAATPAPTSAPAAASFVPDLGEQMTFQQMRHAKLWLAADAGNWELAHYELGEIQEGFAAIARIHPTWKDAPVPIDQAIETMLTDPLKKLDEAIAAKDRRAFAAAFDTLTEGCNACHQATNHGFNVVQRPKANPFPNQSFAPPPP
jgi:hypothetical protein